MRIAKNIYDPQGILLLSAGVLAKQHYLLKLKKYGFGSVFIGDVPSDIEIPEAISESTRNYAVKAIRNTMDSVKAGKFDKRKIERLEKVVEMILNEILEEKDIIINAIDLRSVDDYTFRHSVNVCVLSLMVARALFYSRDRMKELGMGALLHDIGKSLVPEEILKKAGPLTGEEFNIVKKHPGYGYRILAPFRNLSLLSRHIAYQHHEREDGSGYPRRLAANEIIDYAKIVAIIDAYDAMTSDRPYKRAMLPNKAIKELANNKYRKTCDQKIFKFFTRTISPYPIGIKVSLSNGYNGVVTKINPFDLNRPVITLVGNSLNGLKEKRLDLLKDESVFILDSSLEN